MFLINNNFYLKHIYVGFFILSTFYLFDDYYLTEIKSMIYNFSKQPVKHLSQSCNVYIENYSQFAISIDGKTYPKFIPIYENKSINFDLF